MLTNSKLLLGLFWTCNVILHRRKRVPVKEDGSAPHPNQGVAGIENGAVLVQAQKRKAGRPKGSKNKPKAAEEVLTQIAKLLEKRKNEVEKAAVLAAPRMNNRTFFFNYWHTRLLYFFIIVCRAFKKIWAAKKKENFNGTEEYFIIFNFLCR